MKTFLLLAFVIGIVLNSDCIDMTPKKSDDCLSIYSPENICCEHRINVDGVEKRSCVEKEISYSGKNEYEETLIKGVKTKEYLTCSIKIDFCGSITADEANECLKTKIPNGLCCFDHKQGVCFSSPFHFKSEAIICEMTEKLDKPEKPKKKKWWPFLE